MALLIYFKMKKSKYNIKNTLFFLFVLLLVIPQTRQQIQVFLNKGIAMFSPSVNSLEDVEQVSSYDWQLVNLKGEKFNLNQSKSRVVLVNIWATWCPPCIAEMPSIQKLSNDYKDKIDIVLVSNEKQEVIKQFLEKKEYNLEVFTPVTNAPETFNVRSIPRTFLIDRNGNIIIDESGAANWNSDKVRATINELIKL